MREPRGSAWGLMALAWVLVSIFGARGEPARCADHDHAAVAAVGSGR